MAYMAHSELGHAATVRPEFEEVEYLFEAISCSIPRVGNKDKSLKTGQIHRVVAASLSPEHSQALGKADR
jgi:hypothetical protein